MIKRMKHMAGKAILCAQRMMMWCGAVCRERKRWHSRPGTRSLRVYYGHDHIPRRDEPASGGIVKCQDLETIFPNTPVDASLIYLVSSALPSAPHVLRYYARRSGVKLVWNQNGVAIPAYHGTRCEHINGPRRKLFLDADYVVFQSRFCETTSRRYLGERHGPGEILYNPVDTSVFTPCGHTLRSATPVLMLAGSHCHAYRVFSALDGVAELKRRGQNVKLILAGRLAWGPHQEDCLREVISRLHALGIEDLVAVQGAYLQRDAVRVLGAADILLHTKYMDPCPRLVVEAMACGLPVVYLDSGGVPELVGDEAGVAIPVPKDWNQLHVMPARAMADAVIRVVEQYARYSTAARQRAVLRFDVGPWLARHKAIFEQIHEG